MPVQLVPMAPEHREAVIDIFNHYITHSFAAFPEHPIPYAAFDTLLRMCEGYPHAVALDDEGQVVGFGMLRAYHAMPVFRQTAEISYFLKPGYTSQGIGSQLLEHFCTTAQAQGITSILASISALNEGSIRFHQRHGFVECGRFRNIGTKQGYTFDVVWMQRTL